MCLTKIENTNQFITEHESIKLAADWYNRNMYEAAVFNKTLKIHCPTITLNGDCTINYKGLKQKCRAGESVPLPTIVIVKYN